MTSVCYLNEVGLACALGADRAHVAERVFGADSGVLTTTAFSDDALPLGVVTAPLPSLADRRAGLRSRNNQLALLALEGLRDAVASAVARYGAARVGVVVGSSTSGIGESEVAMHALVHAGAFPEHYALEQQELGAVATFLATEIGARGPVFTHSSACASGAKAMASAARLLRLGLADAVVTGGVDSLCRFTVAGFRALGLVSTQRCNPLSGRRDGINIGEAAALFLMTREPAPVSLAGWGESADAHHFSSPDPSGQGAERAITQALAKAGLTPAHVDYVNLHATGTAANDAMESAVVHRLFGDRVAVSGTKPLTGHTLGAAGALEAAICWLAMQPQNEAGQLPPHLWDGAADAALPTLRLVEPGDRLGRPPTVTLSTSFAFGGANAALVFRAEPTAC